MIERRKARVRHLRLDKGARGVVDQDKFFRAQKQGAVYGFLPGRPALCEGNRRQGRLFLVPAEILRLTDDLLQRRLVFFPAGDHDLPDGRMQQEHFQAVLHHRFAVKRQQDLVYFAAEARSASAGGQYQGTGLHHASSSFAGGTRPSHG